MRKTSLSTTSVLKYVFADSNRLERYDMSDENNSEEDRYQTLGLVGKVLFVVYTERQDCYRIISARLANKEERRGEYTMQMERREVQIGDQPTPEMLKEIEEAAKHPIKYTEESPELTAKELSEFKPYYMVNHNLYKPRKVQITIRIDADVLEAFKSEGSGYQTKINDALRSYVFG